MLFHEIRQSADLIILKFRDFRSTESILFVEILILHLAAVLSVIEKSHIDSCQKKMNSVPLLFFGFIFELSEKFSILFLLV